MEPLEEEPRRRVQGGCSVGRIVNTCIGFNFLLTMVTSLVVVGILGSLDLALSNFDAPRVYGIPCPLFMYRDCPSSSACTFKYGSVGVCYFVEVAYGAIAFVCLVYFVVQIVRAVFQFDLWFTAIVDLMVVILLGIICFAAATTTSVGQALTCDRIIKHLANFNVSNCNLKLPIPSPYDVAHEGAYFYDLIIATQGAAWFCLLFIFVVFVVAILRVAIFFRRRVSGTPMDIDTTVLTAADDFDDKPE